MGRGRKKGGVGVVRRVGKKEGVGGSEEGRGEGGREGVAGIVSTLYRVGVQWS